MSMKAATTCIKCGLELRQNKSSAAVFVFTSPFPAICHAECAKSYARDLRALGRAHLELSGFDQSTAADAARLRKFFGRIHGEVDALYGYTFVFLSADRYAFWIRFHQPDKTRREIQWYADLNVDSKSIVPLRDAADPRTFHARLWADGYFVMEVVSGSAAEALLNTEAKGAAAPAPTARVERAVHECADVIYSVRVLKGGSKTFLFVRACLHGGDARAFVPKNMHQLGDKMNQPWNVVMRALEQRLKAKWNGLILRSVTMRTRVQLYSGGVLGVNLQWSQGGPIFVVKSTCGGLDDDIGGFPVIFYIPEAAVGPWPLYAAGHDPKTDIPCVDLAPRK